MESQLIVRLDSELKTRFQKYALSEGKNASQVVRELVAAYLQDRDMAGFVGDLWDRLGRKLESHGARVEDVDRAIRDVRTGTP